MRPLLAHFDAWLDTLDGDMRRAMTSPSTWLGVSVLAALVIEGAGVLPVGRALFQLDVTRAAWCFLPTIVPGLALGLLERRRKVTLRTFGLWVVVGAAFFQLFMWSLVCLSQPPGAAMMASFPLLLSGFHGYVFRSSPKHPYIALGVLAGALLALALNHDPVHVAIYLVALPVALGSSLVLGHIAQQGNLARLESIALREAVDAQVLSERVQHQEVLSAALLRLQGTHHDAGNALSGALFNLEQLALETRRAPLDERRCRNIGQMAEDLATSLERLRKLLLDAKSAGEAAAPTFESVHLRPRLEAAAEEARARFPRHTIAVACPPALSDATVTVCGGGTTLDRVLSNVVVNACEGNGVRAAGRVALQLSEPRAGKLVVEIVDDGPGFSEQRLRSPFRAFQTSKAGGSGLGLYTSNRLVQASGGRLSLVNLEGGSGALVQIELQRRLEE